MGGEMRRLESLKEFDLMVADLSGVMAAHERQDFFQGAVYVTPVAAQHAEPQGGGLPFILTIHLGHGHIKTITDLIFDAFDNLTFVFEGLRGRDEQINGQKAEMDSDICGHGQGAGGRVKRLRRPGRYAPF